MNSHLQIIKYLIKQNPRGEAQLGRVKRQIAKKFKLKTLSNITLLQFYRQGLKQKKIKKNKFLEKLLKTREIRTLSGVAPVAVLTKPYPCPGQCAFCPNEKAMPKSYLSNEPAVMRAIGAKFDPYKQVRARIDALTLTGHNTDKIELIIMGGTWSYLPKRYQVWFIQRCFEACNETMTRLNPPRTPPRGGNTQKPPPAEGVGRTSPNALAPFAVAAAEAEPTARGWFGLISKTLYNKLTPQEKINLFKKEQKRNEQAKHRIVGLTLETRPDYINLKEIKRMRELGCTKVELGIQAIDDKILKLNRRGNTVQQIIDATKLLKNAGFKIVYHLMPNLPGSSPAKDIKMYQELFTNPDFQPDMVKIYPCVVTKDSEIYKWWKKGKFKPYPDKQLFKVLLKMKQATPPYVRIIRLIRDIPAESIIAGNKISNLRQDLQREMARIDKTCKCIRCREIKGLEFRIKNLEFRIIKYAASSGVEYFLSFEDVKHDKLLAFLRLRINSMKHETENMKQNILFYKFFPELENAAIIREVHTYGEATPVDEKGRVQHLGLGKKLIKQAEKIAKENGYKKIAVISAVGTRGYYRKLGYKLSGNYMVKSLKY